jgi:rhomboid family GlyGly-CTERM serine protease
VKALRAPLLVFALPAILIAFAPARHSLLLLDRFAVNGSGEIWRLWSGHWVHFSTSHLAWNLAALLVTGAWLERVHPGLLLRHILIAAPIISLMVLVFEPALQTYGGLSGLATGLVVLLSLHQFREPGPARITWAGILAFVAFKAIHDANLSGALLVTYDRPGVRTSTSAHATGAITAVLHYAGIYLFRRISVVRT